MRVKKFSLFSKDYRTVKQLYEEAFPEQERFPFCLIALLASFRSKIDFLIFYDGEKIAGLVYLVRQKDACFLLYLATNARLRSKGYGSRILQMIERTYPDKTLYLNIEDPAVAAENAEQRLRRLAFYEKNGYQLSPFCIEDKEEAFAILVKNGTFSEQTYRALLTYLFFGLAPIQIERRK